MKCTFGICLTVVTSELCPFCNFILGFQDAMPLALQSVMELQEISCSKDEEERGSLGAPGNALNPCDDFVSYLYSQIKANSIVRLKEELLFIYFSEVRNKTYTKVNTNVKISKFKQNIFLSLTIFKWISEDFTIIKISEGLRLCF